MSGIMLNLVGGTSGPASLLVNYLVVAGGGGGGRDCGGGGGAGGFKSGSSFTLSGSVTVTVGAGGAGGKGYARIYSW